MSILEMTRILEFSAADMPRKDICEIKKTLIEALKEAKARNIQIEDNTITFSGGIFRLVSSMNPLVAIGDGRVTVSRDDDALVYRYTLSFTQLMVISLLMTGILTGTMLFYFDASAVVAIVAFVFFFSLFLFLNWAVAIIRFQRMLRKATDR